LVNADQSAEEELEGVALEGLNSGDPIEVGPRAGASSMIQRAIPDGAAEVQCRPRAA
jgi:hypothetical protein